MLQRLVAAPPPAVARPRAAATAAAAIAVAIVAACACATAMPPPSRRRLSHHAPSLRPLRSSLRARRALPAPRRIARVSAVYSCTVICIIQLYHVLYMCMYVRVADSYACRV